MLVVQHCPTCQTRVHVFLEFAWPRPILRR